MNYQGDQKGTNEILSAMEKRKAAFDLPTTKKPLLTTDFSVESIPIPSGSPAATSRASEWSGGCPGKCLAINYCYLVRLD